MASIPPEAPQPTPPAQPDAPPPEFESPTPDIDVPAPMPGGDPGTSQPQPMGFAVSSKVGSRDDGDTADIGSTAGMTASTGGLAGTSR